MALALPGVAALADSSTPPYQPGRVVAWGNKALAQVPAYANSGIVQIAAGAHHALALTGAGRVVGWGSNGQGQLSIPPDIGTVVAIAAANNYSVALNIDGRVVVWGDNSAHTRDVPEEATSNVQRIATGGGVVFAFKFDGSIIAWGKGCCGQTNLPGATILPDGAVSLAPSAAFKSVSISAHVVAVDQNGNVVAWGKNRYDEANAGRALPGAIAVAAGDGFSAELLKSGAVRVWGNNTNHTYWIPCASGTGSTCAPVADFTQIAAGAGHLLGIRSDGTVVAWGLNTSRQATVPRGLSGVEQVAAGADFSLALSTKTAPAQPVYVSAWAGNGSATISWLEPFDGNSPITSYIVWASGGGGSCTSTSATTCTISGLKNGHAYSFTVMARNAIGSSVISAQSARVWPNPKATRPPATPLPALRTGPPATIRLVPRAYEPPPNNTPLVILLTLIGVVALGFGLGLHRRLLSRRLGSTRSES